MAIIRWTGVLLAGLTLVAAGCGGSGHTARGPGAHVLLAASAADVPCKATTARPGGRLSPAFKPVLVVRCYPKAHGVPGRGLWRYQVKQKADHQLAPFVAALRRASVSTPAGTACLAVGYLDPSFVLLDRRGKLVRPSLPVKECGQPFQAAITALEHLPWVTVSVRRTVQLATRAELTSGCNPKWKDVVHDARGAWLPPPSPGGPAFTRVPPRLRVCIYRHGANTFIRGGLISLAAERRLLGDIDGGKTSTRCRLPYTAYAVLFAVSAPQSGGQIAQAELGGCHRILGPDYQVGAVSQAGLEILRAAGRGPSAR
jgi:hypothetical protein